MSAATNRDGRSAFSYSFTDTYPLCAKDLKELHESFDATVLVSPYIPTAMCRETAGWADLDVALVFVADSIWHAVAEAQCVKLDNSMLHRHISRSFLVVSLIAHRYTEE